MLERTTIVIVAVIACLAAGVGAAAADDVYAPIPFDQAKAKTRAWIEGRNVTDADLLKRIDARWAAPSIRATPQQTFQTVIETFGLVDPQVQRLVDTCTYSGGVAPLSIESPVVDGADPFFAANVSLYQARHLAQRRLYDEAMEHFSKIDAAQLVDPATFLYFRSVCEFELRRYGDARKTLDTLLRNTEHVPVRYATVARLMLYELDALKEKSLHTISHKMHDSERRLELSRGGQRVQKVQDEIVADLDELIEKLEQQASSGGGNQGQGGNNNQPNSAAQDSVIKGSTAPGEVDRKTYRNQAGWGNLDPKEQARAKNEINRKFPAHYHRQVEEYFKKLAKRRAEEKTSN